jgi:hypothetical protein
MSDGLFRLLDGPALDGATTLNAAQTEAAFWRTLHRRASTPAEMLIWFDDNVTEEPYYESIADDENFTLETFKATWYRVRDTLRAGRDDLAAMPLFAEVA